MLHLDSVNQGWAWESSFLTSSRVVLMVVVCRAWEHCHIREDAEISIHSTLGWLSEARHAWTSQPPCLLIPVGHKGVLVFCIFWDKKRVGMSAATPYYGCDTDKFTSRGRNQKGKKWWIACHFRYLENQRTDNFETEGVWGVLSFRNNIHAQMEMFSGCAGQNSGSRDLQPLA